MADADQGDRYARTVEVVDSEYGFMPPCKIILTSAKNAKQQESETVYVFEDEAEQLELALAEWRKQRAIARIPKREDCTMEHDPLPWHPIGRLYLSYATEEEARSTSAVFLPHNIAGQPQRYCKEPTHYEGAAS